MRLTLVAALAAATLSAGARAAPGAPAAAYPQGLLPDTARPTAYRLDFTILPDRPRFTGHTEIDIDLARPAARLFLHGRNLTMTKVTVTAAGTTTAAHYRQLDGFGVSRLDFGRTLPAGKATLRFDYDAPFGDSPSGLYHIKVGGRWYAWTQFESIDARAAYPGFDQPSYKTPFAVTVTTAPGLLAYSNAAETATRPHGALVTHVFAPTKPLPTYLVAFGTGPFASVSGSAAPTAERAAPLPVRIIGTQPNKDKMAFALANTGPIVGLLEDYFGRPFPFPKLDQIGSPVMPGAMENAGADTYGDTILFLDHGAPTTQKKAFGMVVAHELAHQWFGDLVTPMWWDDIWLNESFANWMGYRIGNAWRPDLKINAGALDEGFRAMTIDALKAGRPIHQRIATNGEIDAAFDAVTYGKGGQVVAMIAAYLGDAKFQAGVRLHLDRHAYGNASTDDFFAAMAEAAHDPRVIGALKSFVDQQGVPVVRVERTAGGVAVSQKRYAMLGTAVAPERWTIPLCLRVGATRHCDLLDQAAATVPLAGDGAIMPNAGGTGYYRFSLSEPDWRRLIADAASLSPGEALATTDSLWAAFRAGEVDPALLVEEARTMAANAYSGAATDGGERLAALRTRGWIPDAELPALRALLTGIYAPKLAALGFDPKAGVYAAEDPDRQALRSDIVALLVEAQDPAVRATLAKAATAYLAGDITALDQSLLDEGFAAYADAGPTALATLFDKAVGSDDSQFRHAALGAVGGTGVAASGQWVLAHIMDPRLRPSERLALLRGLVDEPATRNAGYAWFLRNYDDFVRDNGIFYASSLPGYASGFCSVEQAAALETALRPKVERYRQGGLSLDRTVEQVRDCGVLQQARGAAVRALFSRSGA